MENTSGADPVSLTLNTTMGTYLLPLIEDTYVNCYEPDVNFDGDEFGVYARNHADIGRVGLVQFDMSSLPTGLTSADITSVNLTGMTSYNNGRSVELEILGLDVNPDLTTVTYNDLFSDTGSNVFTGYDPNGRYEFVLGSQATALTSFSFVNGDIPVGDTLTFPSSEELLDFVKANISATEEVTITLTVDPGGTESVYSCDFRFYATENTDGQNPMSLAIIFADSPKVPGDANNDGKVDGSDVTILANHWQAGVGDPNPTKITWEMGDFNGDGQVDGSDVTILANNWQSGVTAAAATVPEPSVVVLLVTICGSFFVWKRIR